MQRKKKIIKANKSNQAQTKLGKLKKMRNKTKLSKPVFHNEKEEGTESPPPLSARDLKYLKSATEESFLSENLSVGDSFRRKRKRNNRVENESLEEKYEQESSQPARKKQKHLLPIKTADGLVLRTEDLESSDEEHEENFNSVTKEEQDKSQVEEDTQIIRQFVGKTDVSVSELLASRHKGLQNKKFRIGLLCSGLLESPETKIGNFKSLLELLEEKDPLLRITVRKITLVSLVEVFKDLIPSYRIKHNDDPSVKLKKEVKQLHEFESSLLKAYKIFLQKLEKMLCAIRKKRGDTRIFKEAEIKLAELALQGLCDLLLEHPYFNFSKNIIYVIVPFLNNRKDTTREMVVKTITGIFKSDTRGEISLEIVRCINKLVKAKKYNVHPATLAVFLQLKLKDVNLDSEKEEKLKEKKLKSKKHNVLRLSKRERKREKRLKELNKELLETKAEESRTSKMRQMTEITKLVFAIYFNIFKLAPSSKILGAALEGIAKFAHCINIDFYHDLINVLDNLIENKALGHVEELRCVQTVFSTLSYHGATINIDPIRFYTHFYANLLKIDAGKTHGDLLIALGAADSVVIKRRKQLSLQRLIAFTKRLATLSLQVLPNGSLGILTLVRQVLQLCKASTVLLDTDSSFGKGVYLPELEEPEYCNAGASALWELLPLQRHYHPTVQQYASYISSLSEKENNVSNSMAHFLQKDACSLFKDYDASDVKFVPPVTPPKAIQAKKHHNTYVGISNIHLKNYIKDVISAK